MVHMVIDRVERK